DGGNSVLLCQLSEQGELAGCDPERAHGVVVDAGDDSAELAHPRGNATCRGRLCDVGKLCCRGVRLLSHYVHRRLLAPRVAIHRLVLVQRFSRRRRGKVLTRLPIQEDGLQGGSSTEALARAAMPSRRPVKPRPSVVVAFTLM